jgi:hypothetical protein
VPGRLVSGAQEAFPVGITAEDVFAISQGLPPHRHNLVWQIFTNPSKRRLYLD